MRNFKGTGRGGGQAAIAVEHLGCCGSCATEVEAFCRLSALVRHAAPEDPPLAIGAAIRIAVVALFGCNLERERLAHHRGRARDLDEVAALVEALTDADAQDGDENAI